MRRGFGDCSKRDWFLVLTFEAGIEFRTSTFGMRCDLFLNVFESISCYWKVHRMFLIYK